jgi:hypothetical protein
MKKAISAQPAMNWRITLRPGMGSLKTAKVKVFTSPTAFDGYVGTLRSLGVSVSFTSPFVAHCEKSQ